MQPRILWLYTRFAALVFALGASVAMAAPPDTLLRVLDPVILKVTPQFFLPDTTLQSEARCGIWDPNKINIYDEDVTKLPDTISIRLIDSLAGRNFKFPVRGHVTSPFGPRRMYGYGFHFGTDIKLNKGDTVVAVLDGVVRVVRYDRGYGWFVMIAHADGMESLYGHLSKPIVKPGTEIHAGEALGLGGNTGYSFGAHLHFELRFMSVPIDPTRVVSFEDGKLLASTVRIDKSWFQHLVELRMVRYHYIRSGDTLGGLAGRYGTTITRLCMLNGMTTRTLLRIGRPLRVN